MKIIFILSLVSLLVLAVAGVLKERKYSRLVRYAACAITVVFAIVSGIAESYLMPLCIGVAIFSAVSLGLSILAERIKQEGFQISRLYGEGDAVCPADRSRLLQF